MYVSRDGLYINEVQNLHLNKAIKQNFSIDKAELKISAKQNAITKGKLLFCG